MKPNKPMTPEPTPEQKNNADRYRIAPQDVSGKWKVFWRNDSGNEEEIGEFKFHDDATEEIHKRLWGVREK